jgi:hypothetical protein
LKSLKICTISVNFCQNRKWTLSFF